MDTSYVQKVAALAGALLTAPREFPRYVAHLPLWRRQPLDLGLPWFSYGAIRYLEAHLRREHDVFEYGSGGSSVFFARRARRVLSVEQDAGWHAVVRARAAQLQLANLECELHPLANDSLEAFRASRFSQRIQSSTWDVVVVDCYCGYAAAPYGLIRPAAFADALASVRPGGIVVLDDSWMYPELLQPPAGWEVTDFRGTGPCRYGVTSTAIFRRLT